MKPDFLSASKSRSSLSLRSERKDCIDCVRYGLVILNLLFFSLGALLLCLGAWFRAVPSVRNLLLLSTSSLTRDHLLFSSLVVVATGALAIVLGLVGCCGAVSDSKYLLGILFMFLIILFILLVFVAGLGIWLHSKIAIDAKHRLSETFIRLYNGDGGTNVESVAWRYAQSGLHCCGVNNASDYSHLDAGITHKGQKVTGAAFWRSGEDVWPNSCCSLNHDGSYSNLELCRHNQSDNEARYNKGCHGEITSFLQTSILFVSALAALLAVVELVHFLAVRSLEAGLMGLDNHSAITQFSFEKIPLKHL